MKQFLVLFRYGDVDGVQAVTFVSTTVSEHASPPHAILVAAEELSKKERHSWVYAEAFPWPPGAKTEREAKVMLLQGLLRG